MKIKDGFILREIAGVNIIVPIGKRVIDFNGLITLNDTGLLLWDAIESAHDEADLASMLVDEYDVDLEEAQKDVIEFVEALKIGKIIEQ